MLNGESEERWRVLKESYPDAVVFFESDGLFAVQAGDVETLTYEFGLRTGSRWLGFDRRQAELYMLGLVDRGYVVLRASGDNVVHVRPANDKARELRRQRSRSRFMALDPRLVFDATDLDGSRFERWLRREGYGERLDALIDSLRRADTASLGEYGQLYVYPVADWYEPDWELSTMRSDHALLLAKAALTVGEKLPCRVVAPKSQRGRVRRVARRSTPVETPPQRLGQLGFDDLTANWSSP